MYIYICECIYIQSTNILSFKSSKSSAILLFNYIYIYIYIYEYITVKATVSLCRYKSSPLSIRLLLFRVANLMMAAFTHPFSKCIFAMRFCILPASLDLRKCTGLRFCIFRGQG